MRGRKRIVHDNRAVMEFLWKFGEFGKPLSNAVPDWVDSCVAGASRYGGRNPSSPNAMLSALYQLPEISTEVCEEYVNRKWVALGNKPFSTTHGYYFFIRLRMASKAIQFHYERQYGVPLMFNKDLSKMAIILAKGSEINLTKAAAALTQYKFGLSWDKDADLDAVAILLGENGKILPPDDGHISYYGNCTKNKFNNPENPVAGLIHSGDARTGDTTDGDDEIITIDTTKLSDKVKTILLAVTSYSDKDAVPFAAAAAPVAKLYNDKDQVLFEIQLDQNAAFSTCVEFIKLNRTTEGWVVTNLTNPIGDSNKNGLTDLLAAYN